jgi:hypothetical protein
MKKSFTITREELEAADGSGLKATVLGFTGNEVEAASILRSLERYGQDASIDFFEMTQTQGRRLPGGAYTHSWRVRADRGEVVEAESTT